jgi:ATP-dependent DNA helicase RecG
MNIYELEAIISEGEGSQVEFKRTTGQRGEGIKAASSMLNGTGGFVLFGVGDRGELVGQEVTPRTLEDLVGWIRKIDPPVLLEPEVVPLPNGRAVIAIRVPGDGQGPYTFDGRPYIRQGPTTVPMPQEAYRRYLLEQMHPTRRWENQPAYQLTVDDLDLAEITRTVDEAVRRGRLDEPGTRDPRELLLGLDLIRGDALLNAAVVLFARRDRLLPFYPQCLLRMARFRGTTIGEFEDNRQIHGNAFVLFQHAQRFLREHLPVAGRIVPQLFERIDDPLYPPEALREALANALCHRDYQMGGGSVSVAIFDDRLEISSTGRLPFGLTTDDLKRPHPSRPWNPLIAGVFYRRGLIEQWGRGTLRISELAQRAGLASPEFEERGGEIVVRFFPTGYVAPRRIDHPLTPFQQELLEIIARTGPALLGDIRSHLSADIPQKKLQQNLHALREFGLIQLDGLGRGAFWKLQGTAGGKSSARSAEPRLNPNEPE